MKTIAFLFFCFLSAFLCSCTEHKEVITLKRYVLRTYGQDTLFFGDTILDYKKYWATADTLVYRYDSFSADSGDVKVVCYRKNSKEFFYFTKGRLLHYGYNLRYKYKNKNNKKCKNKISALEKHILEHYPLFERKKTLFDSIWIKLVESDSILGKKESSFKYGEYYYSIAINDSCEATFYFEPIDINYEKFMRGEDFD